MTELLTAAQMRAIEQAAIASGEVTGLELMERAGRCVVEAILEWRPELATTAHRAVALCGPGNNGGDGFVVARLLKERGWDVEVFLYGEEAKLPPDAAENARRWREIGGGIEPLAGESVYDATERSLKYYEEPLVREGQKSHLARQTLYIDALFGTGLTRTFDPALREILSNWLDANWENGVAIDIPSGICADSGKVLGGVWPYVSLTVTFHKPKLGHHLGDWQYDCRALTIADIGLHRIEFAEETPSLDEIGPGYMAFAQPESAKPHTYQGLHKETDQHKYAHGHALILSGGPGKGGAARLAARGALRIGAGLVTVGCPPAALQENAARLDAIMLTPVKSGEALAEFLKDDRINALCIGPGLFCHGQRPAEGAKGLVENALTSSRKVVVDADALTILGANPGLFAKLHKNCVLTPHEGEFGRLFPDILAKLKEPAAKGPAYSKVDATREAARRACCTVLFKGADTVIARPDGRCAINSAHYDRAAPWLATAGSGDVLAGFITGLMARGFEPMAACETAAWLHVECALKFGPGLIAEDLPEQLPAVFRDLGL